MLDSWHGQLRLPVSVCARNLQGASASVSTAMSRQNKSVRLLIAMVIAVVIAVVLFAIVFRRHEPQPIAIKPPETAPASQPTTQPVVEVEAPPRTYFELLH